MKFHVTKSVVESLVLASISLYGYHRLWLVVWIDDIITIFRLLVDPNLIGQGLDDGGSGGGDKTKDTHTEDQVDWFILIFYIN